MDRPPLIPRITESVEEGRLPSGVNRGRFELLITRYLGEGLRGAKKKGRDPRRREKDIERT